MWATPCTTLVDQPEALPRGGDGCVATSRGGGGMKGWPVPLTKVRGQGTV